VGSDEERNLQNKGGYPHNETLKSNQTNNNLNTRFAMRIDFDGRFFKHLF
jgi:hypothetical protein